MKIVYDEGVDGFVVPIHRLGEQFEEAYLDQRGRERNRVSRKPGKVVFMKFLREKDWDDYYEVGIRNGCWGKEPEELIYDIEKFKCKEGMEWVEETYVPNLTKYQLDAQQVLDLKEKIENANRNKPVDVPNDPVAPRNDVELDRADGNFEVRYFNAPQEIPVGEWVEEADLNAEVQPDIHFGQEPVRAGEPVYAQRGNAGNEWAININRLLEARVQPPVPAENDPNRVIPPAENG